LQGRVLIDGVDTHKLSVAEVAKRWVMFSES